MEFLENNKKYILSVGDAYEVLIEDEEFLELISEYKNKQYKIGDTITFVSNYPVNKENCKKVIIEQLEQKKSFKKG